MANNLINSTIILNESLRIIHNKNNYLSNISHQYDQSFKEYGSAGKPGTTLQIRKPNRYTSRTGLSTQIQGNAESTVTLTVANVRGIDLDFNDVELRMNVNDFTKQFIEPAINQLATDLENEVFSTLYKDVYNVVGTAGQIPGTGGGTSYSAFQAYGNAKVLMNRGLTPKDNKWCMIVPSTLELGALKEFKGLFQDSSEISKQYLEGKMGRHMGYNWYTNELAPTHTNLLNGGSPAASGAGQTGNSLLTSGWTANTTIAQGSVFSFTSGTAVNMVHPETRKSYGALDVSATVAGATAVGQQFTVTANAMADANGNATLLISPAIVTSGNYQTVTASPDAGATLGFVGSASTVYPQGLAFHPDAFTFVTADLELPKGMDMADRKNFEGISMRFVRGYDIVNARMISRIDILYGYLTLYPQWACRVIGG
jgi:P22 coat protein - gene protein 5